MDPPKIVVELTDEPTAHAIAQHYRVTLRDSNDKPLGEERIFSVGSSGSQDVCDVAAYTMEGGVLKIGVNTSLRPVLATRELLGATPHSGIFKELPASIIFNNRGHSGITEAAMDACQNKLHVEPIGKLESLGGSYALSPGTSTEFSFPRAIEVHPSSGVFEGTEAKRWQKVEFVPVQDIVTGYLTGEYEDTRLVAAAFRLAEKKGVKLNVPIALSSNTKDNQLDLSSRVLSISAAHDLLRARPGKIATVDIAACDAPQDPFVRTHHLNVTNITEDGAEKYSLDMIARKNIDAIDVGCYSWNAGKLYMYVRLGARPALAVRNHNHHPVHTDINPLMYEGVAATCQGTLDKSLAISDAIIATRRELGFELSAHPVYVGSDFPSAGYSCEKVHRVLVEVDPLHATAVHDQDTEESFMIEINDLLKLEKQGAVRDPRLLLNAHIIKTALQYPDDATTHLPDDDALSAQIDHGSELQACLYKYCPVQDQLLSRSHIFRRLKTYCENELGLLIYDFEHPDEKHFFSAAVPIMAMPHPPDPRKLAFYVAHDFRHYTSGDYIPWRFQNGNLTPMGYEEFSKMLSHDECDAVFFSDVLIPQIYGIDDAERLFGGMSVAGAFRMIGMNNDEAMGAIISLERDGIIPEQILHSEHYDAMRGVIVDRLLRYHISDKHHTKIIHDNWMSNPVLGTTALRFCNAFNEQGAYVQSFKDSLEAIKTYSEGVNPLRALVSRTDNNDVRLTALHLAHMIKHVQETGTPGAEAVIDSLYRKIDELESVHKTLGTIRAMVKDVDISPTNIGVYRTVTGIRDTVIPAYRREINNLYNSKWITPMQKAKDAGRVMPYFPNLAAVDEVQIRKETYELEARQRTNM